MMMQSSRKPPLPRSPIHLRLRPRRPLQSTSTNIQTNQTPPGSLVKSQLPRSGGDTEGCEIRPEYRTISCELRALAKMVHQEFSSSTAECGGGGGEDDARLVSANRSPLFERGRFYEEYSARRNERLKRKKKAAGGAGYDHLGVRVESAKRRDTNNSRRFESLRKTVPCTPLVDRNIQAALPPPSSTSSRYSLRSRSISKENKKPPSAVNGERSSGIGAKKIGVRRGRNM